ncbi:hypothetical protein [Rhizobium ruizarguesonis]|uniref:hypothetical protein n=1 Tax=Rhizobium ruizarguesonis TaxID=2081791 RepID=UPI00102F33EC|nr:hypothetical protein [Rhizobium ruizarguesonis]TAV00332.1 hypothetical protein ELI39_31015 [Rhizobium ruizarguesonis]
MKSSLSDVLPLLNANCGDVLKVALLHEFFPTLPKINPMWLKAPTGNIEAAFSALQAAKEPVTRADVVLTEFKQDAVRQAPRPVKEDRESKFIDPKIQAIVRENTTARTLADMPAGIRFDDSPRSSPEVEGGADRRCGAGDDHP